MAADKKKKLELTIANLQDKWGIRAVRRGSNRSPAVPHVPTGFSNLDQALTIGGLPCGRISEIAGRPTSGMATAALKIIANGQAQGGPAVYLDPGRSFDPDYAARCGVVLDRLVLVRPYTVRQGLAILQDFILSENPGSGVAEGVDQGFRGGGLSVLVFDDPEPLRTGAAPDPRLAMALDRIIAPLARTTCVLLFLRTVSAHTLSAKEPAVSPRTGPLAHYAAVRLQLQRERWLYRRGDISGYQAQVLVVKNKFGPASRRVQIAITFNGVVAPGSDLDGEDEGPS